MSPILARTGCAAAALLLSAALASAAPPSPQTASVSPIEVDVELVLAVDVSYSMDLDEQRVQRDGYIAAIRSPEFIDAVRNGALGKIALSYVEWGGIGAQKTTVEWRVIENEADAQAFADELAEKPIIQIARTSISGAIQQSVSLIKSNPYQGLREVIDISGDGPNNAGQPVSDARDAAAEKGVIINGLPLLLKKGYDSASMELLDVYYKQCIITGPGSFVLPVRSKEEFGSAIRQKIIREIAAAPVDDNPLISLASDFRTNEPKVNCLAGELLIQQLQP
jgi:Protein of unknown function (DUF1194)